jgi:hypothetical protein
MHPQSRTVPQLVKCGDAYERREEDALRPICVLLRCCAAAKHYEELPGPRDRHSSEARTKTTKLIPMLLGGREEE